MRIRSSALRLAALIFATTLLSGAYSARVCAADIFWDAGTATWFDTANWNPAQLPVAGDDVHIDNGGTAQVDAAGAVGSELCVGEIATGFLEIDAGGTLAVTQTHIGLIAGSSGAVTVAGGAWNDSTEIRVGDNGDGALTISAGGQVNAAQSLIGTFSTSTGMATVTGTGSEWIHRGSINVGRAGMGTLLIEAGGQVSNTLGTIGELAGGVGEVTVTGADSICEESRSGLAITHVARQDLTLIDTRIRSIRSKQIPMLSRPRESIR